MNDRRDCCLAVFAKHWTPGLVKTRLARDIGAQLAADIYHEFVKTSVRRLSNIRARHTLAASPARQQALFAEMAPNWQVVSQSHGDLGARLHSFFEMQFNAGYQRVVIVGADSPNLPLEFIDQAFDQLNHYPVALGPSDDGGYYLIGARDKSPPVLNDISWGGRDVWAQSVAKLAAANVPFAELPRWYDVDELPDLQRLATDLGTDMATDLESSPDVDQSLVALGKTLQAVLRERST